MPAIYPNLLPAIAGRLAINYEDKIISENSEEIFGQGTKNGVTDPKHFYNNEFYY